MLNRLLLMCVPYSHRPTPHCRPASPLSTVASRMQAELPTDTDTELKTHLSDLLDHVHALRDQTSSMVK